MTIRYILIWSLGFNAFLLYLLYIGQTIRDVPKLGYTHFSCTASTAASTRDVTLSLAKTDSRCFSTVF